MKGITPIISTIILLLITIALAGAAWTFFSGYLGAQTAKSFIIPSSDCVNGRILVYVTNTGISPLNTTLDFIVATVDGVDVRVDLKPLLLPAPTPAAGGVSLGGSGLALNTSCGGTCSTGIHTVKLATATTELTKTVTCT
jgi:flagellin-like protein